MQSLATGWNTWDTYSMYNFVSLPENYYIKLSLKDELGKDSLTKLLWYNTTISKDQVKPLAHTFDGTYTESLLEWKSLVLRVQSTKTASGYLILVTPETKTNCRLVVRAGYVWSGNGRIHSGEDGFTFLSEKDTSAVFVNPSVPIRFEADTSAVFETPLKGPIAISIGERVYMGQAVSAIESGQRDWEKMHVSYGDLSELHKAMVSVLGWNTIWDESQKRVLVPVSRSWNTNWNGYVLFCWDSYFASYMISQDNRDLAYAVATEITRSATPGGFVPNFAGGGGFSSIDRSQPPVGSRMILEIYKRYKEEWFLKLNYNNLAAWNRWWPLHRQKEGLLCWGSDKINLKKGERDPGATNSMQGAMYESGLDNSPMYDQVKFDTVNHMMYLADVGLTSMYIMDCDAMAEIAEIIGEKKDADEFASRAEAYRKALQGLWDENTGIYRNKDLTTGKLSSHLSPTNFYPMLARVPTQAQAERMVRDHLLNPEEFDGDWVLPSIARNDPGYTDNEYWRGRIWGPMNFLVYLGLRNYDLPEARSILADKSANLLLKEWTEEAHVHENYNSTNADGDDVRSSDPFYHWGALLAYIKLLEKGPVFPADNRQENAGNK
ncbi:MAG: trehalase family glycosidase [Bacteroidales bacterium]